MSSLQRYPRPSVAVDIAVLTVANSATDDAHLAVLVLDREDSPAGLVLPGRFLRPGETTRTCITTALRDKAGIESERVEPRLLQVFDAPDRDPRGWTISLGFVVIVSQTPTFGRLEPVDDLPHLLFDHDVIVASAVEEVRRNYDSSPDPAGIFDKSFTLSELRNLHSTVLGRPLQRDSFRRLMEPQLKAVVSQGRQQSRSSGGRPARVWTTPT